MVIAGDRISSYISLLVLLIFFVKNLNALVVVSNPAQVQVQAQAQLGTRDDDTNVPPIRIEERATRGRVSTVRTSLTNFKVTIPTALRQCEISNLTFSGSYPSTVATRNLTVLWVNSTKIPSTLMRGTTNLTAVKALNATILSISNISVADNIPFIYTLNITNGTSVGLFAFYSDGTGLYSSNSTRKIALPGPGPGANCIVPTCKSTEYLLTTSNTCGTCSSGFVNSTSCSQGTGALTCSYGVPTIVVTGQPAQCRARTCARGTTLSADGKSCLNCSGTTGCDAGCGLCPQVASSTRCNTGYYQPNVLSSCKLCSSTFINSTACSSTGATTCSYGVPTKVSTLNQCVAVKCTTAQYLSSNGMSCGTCSTTFTGSLTCDFNGAITCSTGVPTLVNGVKQCRSIVCAAGTYANAAGTACIACSTTFPNSTACSSAGATQCSYGAPVGVPAQCKVATCTTGQYLNAQGTCTPCSVTFPNSTACSATGATGCSYGVPTGSPAQCKSATCTSTQYLSSTGACIPCSSTFVNSTACSATGATACSYGLPTGSPAQCAVATCTTGQYLNAQGTCTLCSVTFPNSTACSATGATGCSYGVPTGSPAQCKSATCISTQYLSSTGACIPCSTTFINSTTCSLSAGATACSYGSPTSVNGSPAQCTASSCAGSAYLNLNGTCTTCPDKNALTCDQTGKSTTCSFGAVAIGATVCSAVTCAGATYLATNGASCTACPDTNAATCDSTGRSLTCTYGAINSSSGLCSAVNCATATPSYLAPNGSYCINCAANVTSCNATSAITCAYGSPVGPLCLGANCTGATYLSTLGNSCIGCGPNATTCNAAGATNCAYGVLTGSNPVTCGAVVCNSTSLANVNGTSCTACSSLFPNATACTAAGPIACSYGSVTAGINGAPALCSPIICPLGQFANANATTCSNCNTTFGAGTTSCTLAAGALTCSYGSPTGTPAQCTSVACNSTQYSVGNGTQCLNCGDTWPNSTACSSTLGATACAVGVPTINTSTNISSCAPTVCPYAQYPTSASQLKACQICSNTFVNSTICTEAGGAGGCQYGSVSNAIPAQCVSPVCDPTSATPFLDATGIFCTGCSTIFNDPNVATCNANQILSCTNGKIVDPTTNSTCVDPSIVAGYTCQSGDPLATACSSTTSTSCLSPASLSGNVCSMGYAAVAGGPDVTTTAVATNVPNFYSCVANMPCPTGNTMMYLDGSCYCQSMTSFDLANSSTTFATRRVILPGSCATFTAAGLGSGVVTGPMPNSCLDFGYFGGQCLATYGGLKPGDCANFT